MQEAKEEATILGSGQKTTAELAGLVNGRPGKAWEHEDKYWVDETIGFAVGCCVVPAALATAQASGRSSGKDVATAVALAVDLEARLLRPLGLGFVMGRAAANATFALGTYGAAVAATARHRQGRPRHPIIACAYVNLRLNHCSPRFTSKLIDSPGPTWPSIGSRPPTRASRQRTNKSREGIDAKWWNLTC